MVPSADTCHTAPSQCHPLCVHAFCPSPRICLLVVAHVHMLGICRLPQSRQAYIHLHNKFKAFAIFVLLFIKMITGNISTAIVVLDCCVMKF